VNPGTSAAFARASAEGRAALVGYLPGGFPSFSDCLDALCVLVDSGCDVIEVGLPYSDPVMDGQIIQTASRQALAAGTRTTDVLRLVEAVASTGVPTVVMTYWGPVEKYGVERFAADLASAGGAGLVTPDLTPDSASEWIAAADTRALDKIYLVAPSSSDERLAMTAAACRGFLYATAVMGVTGARDAASELAAPLVARARTVTEMPIAVGLGIGTPAQAADVASYADGVIVGSALVRVLLDRHDDSSMGLRELGALLGQLRVAMSRE
jgi:tryptophan synthase alpha chain